MELNRRETGTILSALRGRQRLDFGTRRQDPIATDEGRFRALTDREIDRLCEKLNLGGTTPSEKPDPESQGAKEGGCDGR